MKPLSSHRFRIVCLLGGIVALLLSCQKVIDVRLRDADKKYVIEGFITTEDTCRVLLSQTKNFSDSNGFAGISGAVITVQRNNEAPVALPEVKTGIYETLAIKGLPGNTYMLTVKVNGQSFTATSVMPQKVSFDSLFITLRQRFDGSKARIVTAQFNDPPGKGQAYRFVKIVNGQDDRRILVRDDALTDGRTVKAELRGSVQEKDTVLLQMQCIDYPVYRFWYTLDQNARGSSDSPAPANPLTNIKGGALGYFSAHTVQERTMIVK